MDLDARAGWPLTAPIPSSATATVPSGGTSATLRDRKGHAPTWLVVTALVAAVLGVALRWIVPGGLWLDEALGVNIAKVPLGDLVDALRRDGHPPLYTLLLKVWMVPFGDGDRGVRSLSMVVSTATLPLAWLAGRRLAGPVAGWSALALLALSPFAVRYGSEARMYALVQLLVVVGVLAVAAALARPTIGALAGVAGIVAALVLTHYWSWYLVAATAIGLAVLAWRSTSRRRVAGRVLLAMGVGALAFVPWLPVFFSQLADTGTPWGRTRNPLAVLGMTLNGLGGNLDVDGGARVFHGQLLGAAFAATLLLAVLGAAGSGGGLVLRWPPVPVPAALAGIALLTLGLGALGCLLTGSAFASRYAAAVVVLLVLAAATGLDGWPLPAVAVALAVLLPFGALGAARAATEPRTQIAELAAVVNEEAAPGDLVVTCPDQLGPALSRRLRPDVRAVTYPNAGDPRFVDWRDYAARHRAADPVAIGRELDARAGDATIWYLWSGGYRWLDTQCERLAEALGAARDATTVATADPTLLEHATLVRFGAR